MPETPQVAVPAMPVPRPVITAGTVAMLLNRTENWFFERRDVLEKHHGFPPKLPGLAGWSYACVMRWIETNGQTFLPSGADAAVEPGGKVTPLTRRFG